MILFLILSYFRTKLAVLNGEVEPWLLTFAKITTPIEIALSSVLHLWFVNSPQMESPEGYGFIGHYLPYMGFQISLVLVAINQLYYTIAIDKIPFGVPAWAATYYVRFVIITTIVCQACVISILMGSPILDSAAGGKEGTWEREAFVILGKVYASTALFGPFIFSCWEMRNGDTNTFTIAHQ
jgi:hypothetical protein